MSVDTFMSYFNKLVSKYGEVVNKHLIKKIDPPSNLNKQNDDINRNLTIDEIITMVKKAKNNKAYGFDNIINEFLNIMLSDYETKLKYPYQGHSIRF